MITVAELKKQRMSMNQEFLNRLDTDIQVVNKKGKLKYRVDLPDAVDVDFICRELYNAGYIVQHLKGDGGFGCLHENPYNYLNISWELETEANANGDYCRWEDVEAELNSLKALIEEAPNFFAPQYDFDGKKREWLIKAGLIEENQE